MGGTPSRSNDSYFNDVLAVSGDFCRKALTPGALRALVKGEVEHLVLTFGPGVDGDELAWSASKPALSMGDEEVCWDVWVTAAASQ